MVVFLLLFVATVGLIISMSKIDKQTDATTTLYTATVTGVDITDMGDKASAEIHTREYRTSLYISTNIAKSIKMEDIRSLKDGQTISFRIENIKVRQMNEVEFVNIVSLRTDTKEILSLDDYNKFIYNSAYPARVASVVMALLFLTASLFCWLKIKRKA